VDVARRQFVRTEENSSDVHSLPDSRTREGVPLQPLPDATTSHRDSAPAAPHRATDQDLVPEPAHEVEEGEQRRQADGSWRGRGRGEGWRLPWRGGRQWGGIR